MNLTRPAFLDNLVYLNPWRKSRLETYILQTCISAFVSALMIVAALIFLIEYVGISKTLGAKADVSGLSVIGLMLEKSPGSILVLLPSPSCSAPCSPSSISIAAVN